VSEGPDPVGDALDLLLGDEAWEIIDPALLEDAEMHSLRVQQVLFRPRQRATVTYHVGMELDDGTLTEELIAATVDRSGLPEGAIPSQAGELPVALWPAEEDPLLPGLQHALDPEFALRMLEQAGTPAKRADVTLVAYRPGRRAVVEVTPVEPVTTRLTFAPGSGALTPKVAGDAPALFLKVVEPDRAAELAEVHRRLTGVVPAAPCTLADGPGILQLGAVHGVSLGTSLRRGRPRPPDVEELTELLDRLEEAGLEGSPSSGSDSRLRRFTELLAAVVPDEADRLERLTEALSGSRAQPTVAVHGDFHEGNILVGEGRVTGLLDVDDAGPGERVDDLGLLVGRLWSLGHGRGGKPVLRYTEELLRHSDRLVDPGELRRRVGVALIGRATGPFRNQLDDWEVLVRRRLDQAERWVADVAPMLRDF
jgi:phosphotransferase family enzyme